MTDKLGNDVIKLQKEIMNITYNINTVRDKTHKSMSSILNGLKSFPKYKSTNPMLDLSQKNINKNQKMKIINDKYYSNFNNSHAVYRKNSHTKKNSSKIMNEFYSTSKKNIINYKQKIDRQIPKKNNGIILSEFENYYSHNKKDSFSKNNLLLEKSNNIKKDNQPVKCEINSYNNYMSSSNMSNDENIILNDNSKLNHQIKNNRKKMPKTDSFKYLYPNNNFSNDYIYNEIDDLYKRNYNFDNDYNNNNYYKKELRHTHFINKILNENTCADIKSNRKSRNKSENEFKHKEIEMEKNNDEAIDYKDFFNKKTSKTFYSDIMQKNNNYNNYISRTNKNTHHKKHKNKFREKASTKNNSKDKIKYNDYHTFNEIDIDDNINHIYKLLNAKNQIDCIYKINKLLTYEDFIHKLKKLYYNFNDHNKDFKLKDILFWISMNSSNDNNNRKRNKYEEFCHEIMKKFNIHDFENFKMFFYKLVKKDKNSHYFVNEMKELFNNFNEFQPNKTIYRNKSNKNIQNFSNNEDDINN